jgi:hypothetical protein
LGDPERGKAVLRSRVKVAPQRADQHRFRANLKASQRRPNLRSQLTEATTTADSIEKIRAELSRLRACVEDVGRDGIEASDRAHGNVLLHCRRGRNFEWFGSAEEVLEGLSNLPDDGGHEVVRSEFTEPPPS